MYYPQCRRARILTDVLVRLETSVFRFFYVRSAQIKSALIDQNCAINSDISIARSALATKLLDFYFFVYPILVIINLINLFFCVKLRLQENYGARVTRTY